MISTGGYVNRWSNFYCGLPVDNNGNYIGPTAYSIHNFSGHINECTFSLQGRSMNDGNIKCFHDIDLCRINADDATGDYDHWHMTDTNFTCELSPTGSQCILNCGLDDSCQWSTFTCNAPDCQCIGGYCDGLTSQTIDTAPPSTSILGYPSNPPSIAPSVSPTTSQPTSSPITSAPSLTPNLHHHQSVHHPYLL